MTTKAKRKVAPKYAPLTVDGDDYLVRTNISMGTVADMQSGDYDRVIKAIRTVVKEHPWVDDDDKSLDPEEWEDETGGQFIKAYGALMKALPPV